MCFALKKHSGLFTLFPISPVHTMGLKCGTIKRKAFVLHHKYIATTSRPVLYYSKSGSVIPGSEA